MVHSTDTQSCHVCGIISGDRPDQHLAKCQRLMQEELMKRASENPDEFSSNLLMVKSLQAEVFLAAGPTPEGIKEFIQVYLDPVTLDAAVSCILATGKTQDLLAQIRSQRS